MGVTLLPYQPIQFIEDSQPCKNSDNRFYAQLMQEDDDMCVQWKQTPRASTEHIYGDLQTDVVINGNFTGNADDWTLEAGWAYGSNAITHTPGAANLAYQVMPAFIATNSFIVTFTVSGRTAGTVRCVLGVGAGGTQGTIRSTNATFTETLSFGDAPVDNVFSFEPDAAFDGTIDSVIVMGVPNSGSETWTSDGLTTYTHITGTQPLTTIGYGVTAGYYAIEVVVTDMTAGSFTIEVDGETAAAITGNGTHRRYYLTTASGDGEISFIPTTDFNGSIAIDFVLDEYLTNFKAYLIQSSVRKTDKYDLVYEEDFMTWCFTISDLELSGNAIDYGLYSVTLQYIDGVIDQEFTSINLICYAQEHECTYVVDGDCNPYHAFGFYWDTFHMVQRLRVLRIAPKYPGENQFSFSSTGALRSNYTQTQKIWTCWFDKVDENTHDCIRIQLKCDDFTIDDIEYFCPQEDYTPDWGDRMRRNLSESMVDLQKKTDVLFNRNC